MKKYGIYLFVAVAFVILGIVTVPKIMGEVSHNFYKKSLLLNWRSLIWRIIHKYQIVNFMVVGGIGYLVNMGLYYPLTLVFHDKVTFLGQQFYIPPFIISSVIAILCNYYLNKISTFKDCKENRLGLGRYLLMASITLVFDMLLLYLMVEYGGLQPIAGAAIAILIVFIIRYVIAKTWIWSRR